MRQEQDGVGTWYLLQTNIIQITYDISCICQNLAVCLPRIGVKPARVYHSCIAICTWQWTQNRFLLISIAPGDFDGRIHCTRHAVDRGWQTCQISLLYRWLLHGAGLSLSEPIVNLFNYTQGPFEHRLIGAVGNPLWCVVIHSSEFSALIKPWQRLASGKALLDIPRYSKAAITIYVDIVNLFLFLLELFGDRRRWTTAP